MRNLIDMTGQVCGDWTVLRRDDGVHANGAHWICRCKCGTIRPVMGVYLRSGKSTGCGCERTEKMRRSMKKAQISPPESARRAARGICYNVFCPSRDSYKGAWSCRRCHGCEGRKMQRVSEREILKIGKEL